MASEPAPTPAERVRYRQQAQREIDQLLQPPPPPQGEEEEGGQQQEAEAAATPPRTTHLPPSGAAAAAAVVVGTPPRPTPPSSPRRGSSSRASSSRGSSRPPSTSEELAVRPSSEPGLPLPPRRPSTSSSSQRPRSSDEAELGGRVPSSGGGGLFAEFGFDTGETETSSSGHLKDSEGRAGPMAASDPGTPAPATTSTSPDGHPGHHSSRRSRSSMHGRAAGPLSTRARPATPSRLNTLASLRFYQVETLKDALQEQFSSATEAELRRLQEANRCAAALC
jgi:hypothetical protein